MNNIIKFMILIVFAGCLLACKNDDSSKKTGQQNYVVKTEKMHERLFFTGTIQPLQESTITSPLDAVVESMEYHYGQMVKNNDVVVTLNSSDLQKQFNDTLTDYLKAKDSFGVAKAKFTGTQELWDAGLISKNNYLSEKSSLATSRVSLMQSARKLTEMLEKMDDDNQELSALSIAEFEKVRQALTGNHNLIHLRAPAEGILLYPPKSTDDNASHLSVGSAVKAGQVIGLIGDLSGVSVEIDVPEIDIDKIHPGMKATITGVALGKQVLQGEVVSVNAQAIASSGSSLPSFTAMVEVKKLTDSQKPWIKVGMSAAIELEVESESQLLVPIAAVSRDKGASVVTVRQSDGKVVTRQVATGGAQADKVIIESGLRSGDVVVYDQ